jgi:hypothetical protein
MCILCGPPAADMPDRTAIHERGSARLSPPSVALPPATDRRWSTFRSSRGWSSADPAGRDRPYYALLFTLAQYLQQGLGGSPLVSGLALVPWVAAFGLAGQRVRQLPPRMAPLAPGAGCLLVAAAHSAISVMLFSGHHVQALLIVLLGVGGLGLGIQFSAQIKHLTTAVPAEYAADISGVSTTAQSVGSCRRSAVVDLPGIHG